MDSDPLRWHLPQWHDDFGDTELEFSMLKELGSKLLVSNATVDLQLDTENEGYLALDIYVSGHHRAHVQIVEGVPQQPRYAVFTFLNEREDDELYFDNETDCISCLLRVLQP